MDGASASDRRGEKSSLDYLYPSAEYSGWNLRKGPYEVWTKRECGRTLEQ